MTALYQTRGRQHSLAMAAIVTVAGGLLLWTLPVPASAENYPACPATRTDECQQSHAHHAAKSAQHNQHRTERTGKKAAPR